MKNQFNKIKKVLTDSKTYLFLIISIAFFGIFIKMNFATDTYWVIMSARKEIFMHFISCGRVVTAIWFAISSIFSKGYLMYTVSFLLAILFCGLSLYNLYNLIKEDCKNDFLAVLLSVITVINPFSIELFIYIEKGILLFSVFLCICAIEQFVKFLKGEKAKKSLIMSAIYMLIATFSYQGVLGIFLSVTAIYIIKYSKNFLGFIKNNVLMFLCYGIPAIINFVFIRILSRNSRVDGSIVLSETIEKVKTGIGEMLSTYRILPKYFYISIVAVTLVILILLIIKNKKDYLKLTGGLVYVILINIVMTIIPVAMQNTSSIWFVPRATYPFGSILGLLILFAVVNFNKECGVKLKDFAFSTMSIILIFAQFYYFNIITVDQYNLNYTDKINSMNIGRMIIEYEQENNIEVTKISIYTDENPIYTYREITTIKDINVYGFLTDWSDVTMINYYNNLKLEKVDNDEEIAKLFKSKDWSEFDKEQVIIKGDTIHYCRP